MCILFLYTNNNPSEGEYSLILANNRDEHFWRPTKPAHFWSDDCIAGLDNHHGKEGGTWLGMSRLNKISVLLNVLDPSGPDFSKKGRGFLVIDYLKGTEDAMEYMSRIEAEKDLYNGFHLWCLNRSDNKWKTMHYSNIGEQPPKYIDESVCVCTNTYDVNRQWAKGNHGKEIFSSILQQYNDVSKVEELKGALIDMLSDRTSILPDPILSEQASSLDPQHMTDRSCICVYSPDVQYGSRTNSIIMVDHDGNCEFFERTMREPIDADHPVWDTSSFKFKLEDSNCNQRL